MASWTIPDQTRWPRILIEQAGWGRKDAYPLSHLYMALRPAPSLLLLEPYGLAWPGARTPGRGVAREGRGHSKGPVVCDRRWGGTMGQNRASPEHVHPQKSRAFSTVLKVTC